MAPDCGSVGFASPETQDAHAPGAALQAGNARPWPMAGYIHPRHHCAVASLVHRLFSWQASMPSKAKSNSAGKKPMGSGMKQTTLVARRSVVSPSNGSPKSDQLGLGGKKNGKKKKAPTHKKMCLTPRPGNPKTGCSNQPAPAHAAMHLCAALPQTRTRSSSRSQASRLPASFDAHPHTR